MLLTNPCRNACDGELRYLLHDRGNAYRPTLTFSYPHHERGRTQTLEWFQIDLGGWLTLTALASFPNLKTEGGLHNGPLTGSGSLRSQLNVRRRNAPDF